MIRIDNIVNSWDLDCIQGYGPHVDPTEPSVLAIMTKATAEGIYLAGAGVFDFGLILSRDFADPTFEGPHFNTFWLKINETDDPDMVTIVPLDIKYEAGWTITATGDEASLISSIQCTEAKMTADLAEVKIVLADTGSMESVVSCELVGQQKFK